MIDDAQHPLIVAYCTKGSYEGEAARLIESLDRLGLEYRLDVLDEPPAGDWAEIVRLKPLKLLEKLDDGC